MGKRNVGDAQMAALEVEGKGRPRGVETSPEMHSGVTRHGPRTARSGLDEGGRTVGFAKVSLRPTAAVYGSNSKRAPTPASWNPDPKAFRNSPIVVSPVQRQGATRRTPPGPPTH